MAILLDTQLIIWIEENNPKIPEIVLDKILEERIVFISKVAIWEIAIKLKLGKLTFTNNLNEFIDNFLTDYDVKLLDISLNHIYYTQNLDHHHKDPFDRLLAAQSLLENIPIVSSDDIFDKYNVKRLW